VSVSSGKDGVMRLFDGNPASYWQSSGSKPHWVTVTFPDALAAEQLDAVSVCLDDRLDDSWFPSDIEIHVPDAEDPSQWMPLFEFKFPRNQTPTSSPRWHEVVKPNSGTFWKGIKVFRFMFKSGGVNLKVTGLRLTLKCESVPCPLSHVYQRRPLPRRTVLSSGATGWPFEFRVLALDEMLQVHRLCRWLQASWKRFAAQPEKHEAILATRARIAALAHQADVLAVEDFIGKSDVDAIKSLLAKRRLPEADQLLVESITKTSVVRKEEDVRVQEEARQCQLHKYLAEKECQVLTWKFEWSEAEQQQYAELRWELDSTIGLDNVKSFIRNQLNDAAERASMGMAADRRNIFVVGPLGSGKKTAAALIVRLLRLLWRKAGPDSGAAPAAKASKAAILKVGDKVILSADYASHGDAASGPLKPGDVGKVIEVKKGAGMPYKVESEKPSGGKSAGYWYKAEALQKAVIGIEKPSSSAEKFLLEASTVLLPAYDKSVFAELIDPQTKEVDVKPDTIYLLRAGEGMATVKELVDGYILKEMNDVSSIAIICGEDKFTQKLLGLDQNKREAPHRIDLPPLTVSNLARIALLKMRRERLVLQDSLLGAASGTSNSNSDSDSWQVSVLESIVQRTYGPAKIAERNAYWADAMIQVRLNPIDRVLPIVAFGNLI
jgi:hypothetical protein